MASVSPPQPAASSCGASLHGALEQFGLATLLTLMEMERRSGTLALRRAGEQGQLWVRRGRVVRALVEGGSRRRTGKAAVYHLLAWSDGRFEVTMADVDGADEINSATTFLLMEAARRVDESRAELSARAG